ncbi:Uncharacterised protein [Achromobacter sp. 2789STDY5608615]|uniref:hypothetical protein n=1 Tax=Achromobacter sp. 2789STDY5608615 TaxID=1806492 RepID=UPI0006C68F63|nr:hypothetical protein [Achromobacter sp. 2789STDY5608615]CUJ98274.1 Uncharacterised protein [Achromobacter sp. 2789STDY5608615]
MSMTVTTDKLAQVLAAMAQLVKKDVLVGIPDSAPEREGDTPLSNAQIGYILDNGSPKANIPARPFLVPGVENVQPEIVEDFRGGAKAALDGNAAGVERALVRAGLRAQSSVRAKIQDGPFDPLAPRTLADRKKRGRTGEKPLLDTGQLRNSVTYVVRKK